MTTHVLDLTADLMPVTRTDDTGTHELVGAAIHVACTCGELLDVFFGLVDPGHLAAIHAEHAQGADLVAGCERMLDDVGAAERERARQDHPSNKPRL